MPKSDVQYDSRTSSSSSSSSYLGRTAPKALKAKGEYTFKITPQGIMDMLSKIESNDVKDFPSIKEFIKFLKNAFVGKLSPEVKQCFKSYENLLKNPNNNDIYGIIDEISCLTRNAPNVEGTTISRLMYKYYTKIYMQHTAMERLDLADKNENDFVPDEYIQYIIGYRGFEMYQSVVKSNFPYVNRFEIAEAVRDLKFKLSSIKVDPKICTKLSRNIEKMLTISSKIEPVNLSLNQDLSIVNEDDLAEVMAYRLKTTKEEAANAIDKNLTTDYELSNTKSPIVQRFLQKKAFVREQAQQIIDTPLHNSDCLVNMMFF